MKRKAGFQGQRTPWRHSSIVFALRQTPQTYLVVELATRNSTDYRRRQCDYPQKCKSLLDCIPSVVCFDEKRDVVSMAALCMLWKYVDLQTSAQRTLRDRITRTAAAYFGHYTPSWRNYDHVAEFCEEVLEAYVDDDIFPVVMDVDDIHVMDADLKFYYNAGDVLSCPMHYPLRYRATEWGGVFIKYRDNLFAVDRLTASVLGLYELDDAYSIDELGEFDVFETPPVRSCFDNLVELVRFCVFRDQDEKSFHLGYIGALIASQDSCTFDLASRIVDQMKIDTETQPDGDIHQKIIHLKDLTDEDETENEDGAGN